MVNLFHWCSIWCLFFPLFPLFNDFIVFKCIHVPCKCLQHLTHYPSGFQNYLWSPVLQVLLFELSVFSFYRHDYVRHKPWLLWFLEKNWVFLLLFFFFICLELVGWWYNYISDSMYSIVSSVRRRELVVVFFLFLFFLFYQFIFVFTLWAADTITSAIFSTNSESF